MGDESRWENLRRYPRISWNFVVKFRLKDSKQSEWQTSTIKDISEGGCFFYSNVPYGVGQVLEILVKFPSMITPMQFIGEVKRCESGKDKQFSLHGIGICFLKMDEQKRQEFIETISFFLKKQKK